MIHRTKLTIAFTAAALLVAATAGAGPTSAGLHRHKCIDRVPGDCPNQHPVIHGLPVWHRGELLPAVQRTHKPVTHIVKQTGIASPVLYQPVVSDKGAAHGGGRSGGHGRVHGITVTKQTGSGSPVLYQTVNTSAAHPGRHTH